MSSSNINRVNNRTGFGEKTAQGTGFHNKKIKSGLSTQIVIQVVADNGTKYVVGAVQKLDYQQSRTLLEQKEVGTDGIIQIIPQSATTFKINVDRLVFDFQRLPQALQREFRHIHAQRKPFDIVVVDYNPYLNVADPDNQGSSTVDGSGAISPTTKVETTFKNCWFNSLNVSYSADNFQIVETASLQCETVFDSVSVTTLAGPLDNLENATNTSEAASVMSAYDAKLK